MLTALLLRKIWRDLWLYKLRTLLVVVSISLGVAGIGMVGQSKSALLAGMEHNYSETNPSQVTMITESFDRDMLQIVRNEPGIRAAEARRNLFGRINPVKDGLKSPDEASWKDFQLFAVKDFPAITLDRIFPKEGTYPPPDGTILLEETSLRYLHTKIGDSVWLDMGGGKQVRLRIAGTVRDPLKDTAYVTGRNYGYVTTKTLNLLELSDAYNSLAFQVENKAADQRHLQETALRIRDKLGEYNIHVFTITIPPPGRHWAYDMVNSMAIILQVFGILITLIGSTLIINTIYALIVEQTRQIGIMKVVGAEVPTLVAMYMCSVVFLSLLGLLVGIPIGLLAADLITGRSVTLLNFDRLTSMPYPSTLVAQLMVGLGLPVLVSVIPVLQGTRIPEHVAIGGNIAQQPFGTLLVEKIVERIRFLPRPLLLSFRNTFRRKSRLLLTLLTLSLGGAVVISVFSVRSSIQLTVNSFLNYAVSDARFTYTAPHNKKEAEQIALSVSGVSGVESWFQKMAVYVRPDGTKSQDWSLTGAPELSRFMIPDVIQGRWFHEGAGNEIVLNTYVLRQEPRIRLGDSISMSINGAIHTWKVVGFARAPAEIDAFVGYNTLTHMLSAEDQATLLQIYVIHKDRKAAARTAAQVTTALKEAGMGVNSPTLTEDVRAAQQTRYSTITIFLSMMSILLVGVAGLGLMGTMSLNVVERTREIGILRSIGATDARIWLIIIAEGMTIGAISWFGAVLLSYPVSTTICRLVGQALFQANLDYVYPVDGLLVWLAAALLLSAIACFTPAWRASRLTVKDVLNYE